MRMKSLLRCLAPVLLLAAAPLVAQAQNGAGAPAPPLSAEILMAALDGRPAELAALRRYFADASPEDVVDRLGLLLSPLDGPTVVAVADLVIDQARAALSAAHVIRLAVDPSYVPSRGVTAFAFGDAGTPAAPGFERVAPGDPRLTGALTTQPGAGERGVRADGISGLRSIKLKAPGDDPGPYRILIGTRNVSTADSRGGFGQRIQVNGVGFEVRGQNPAEWINFAMLGEPSGGTPGVATDGETLRTGTFSQNQIDDATRQQSGAIVIEAYAVNGEINIELPGDAPIFLTTLMVERADHPSEFVLTPEARDAILSVERRLSLEEQIQIMVASLLEKIEPAVGEPVFPPELTASPS